MFTLSYFLFFSFLGGGGGWGASRLKLMVVRKTFEVAHGNNSCRVNVFVFWLIIIKFWGNNYCSSRHLQKKSMKSNQSWYCPSWQGKKILVLMKWVIMWLQECLWLFFFLFFCAGLPRWTCLAGLSTSGQGQHRVHHTEGLWGDHVVSQVLPPYLTDQGKPHHGTLKPSCLAWLQWTPLSPFFPSPQGNS